MEHGPQSLYPWTGDFEDLGTDPPFGRNALAARKNNRMGELCQPGPQRPDGRKWPDFRTNAPNLANPFN